MRDHGDLRLASWAAAVCALAALLLPFEALRVAFAVPLALLLPGYALTMATFARKPPPWPQVVLFSVALSLCVLALGGLILNYMPGGIEPASWALLILFVVLGGCRAAALRRPPAPRGAPSWPRPGAGRAELAMLGGGAVAAIAAIVLAMTPLPAEEALGYTELWITTASNAENAVASIGVRSAEQRRLDYFLRVRFGREKHIIRLIGLAPGETRTVRVRTDPPTRRPLPVLAALFRQDRPTRVYRRVLDWVPVPGEPR